MSKCLTDSSGNKYWRNDKGLYHREDGPAIEYADGKKLWYIDGYLHREDGPAIEWENGGNKEWFLNGTSHTEKAFLEKMKKPILPVISSDGSKRWFNAEGQYHREDGPAYESISGHKSYYINGKLHRDDGPAIETAAGTKEWWVRGKRHRIDGPAIEWSSGDKDWYLNGTSLSKEQFEKYSSLGIKHYFNTKAELHREDGPALERADGTKEWYLNGKHHRVGGPAIERADGYKEWRVDGFLHREDGPVVEFPDGTKHWAINGKLHRVGGPAIERSDNQKEWYLNGKLHREDGPAVEFADGTKRYYLDNAQWSEKEYLKKLSMNKPKFVIDPNGNKKWCNANGKYHREDGPAIESANGGKEWWVNGLLHRADGPAVEYDDYKEWYVNGIRHRIDGPAVEYNNGYKTWYINGLLHREDGPAAEYTSGTKEYYLKGVLFTAEQFAAKQLSHIPAPVPMPTSECIVGSTGNRYWYNNNSKLHRDDGPAVEYANGDKAWYIDGVFQKEEEAASKLSSLLNNDLECQENILSKIGTKIVVRTISEQSIIAIRVLLSNFIASSKLENAKNIIHFLNSESAKPIIQAMMFSFLTFTPGLSENPKAQLIADEYLEAALTDGANNIISKMTKLIQPLLISAMKNIDNSTTEQSKIRFHNIQKEIECEDVEEEDLLEQEQLELS